MARKKKAVNTGPIHTSKYIAQTRYEHWTREGKVWCNWFFVAESDDQKELKEIIKYRKKTSNNPRMKLKEEYQIIDNPELNN